MKKIFQKIDNKFKIFKNYYFLLFLVNFFAIYINPYSPLFDSALFRLQLIYPTLGLEQYKDFIHIYPFGPSIISIIFSKITLNLFNPIYSVWIFHFILQLIFLKKIIESKFVPKDKNIFLYLFLIFETIYYSKLGGEPFSFLLTFITLFEFLKSLETKKIFFSTFIYPTLLIFFKWDRLVFCISVFILFFILCQIKKIKYEFIHLIKIILVSFFSFVFFIFSLYLFSQNNFLNAFKYIFVVPFIIEEFRKIPFIIGFPILSLYNIYFFLLAIYVLFLPYLALKKVKRNKIFFYCISLSLIPPTFFISDIGHFTAFYLSSFFLIFSFPEFITKNLYSYINKYAFFSKFIFFSFLLLFLVSELNAPKITNTCSNIFFEEKPKSIFVGNSQYDNFYVNFPLIYLNYLHLKPATKYIAEDPGIQNSCLFGNEIINDINLAPKPTIFLLNESLLNVYNNRPLSNCRKIENYISSHTKLINHCKISDFNIAVRISE